MGGSMSYTRFLARNSLRGEYKDSMVAGDLRRLERDQRDKEHLLFYGKAVGISKLKVKLLLDLFFEHDY